MRVYHAWLLLFPEELKVLGVDKRLRIQDLSWEENWEMTNKEDVLWFSKDGKTKVGTGRAANTRSRSPSTPLLNSGVV